LNTFLAKHHQSFALAVSIGIHVFALYGIVFTPPEQTSLAKSLQPLQVVLVNTGSNSRPDQADALANRNLDGGGNTEKDLVAKSPLPTTEEGKQFTPEQSAMRLQMLEQEATRLMTQVHSLQKLPRNKKPQEQADGRNGRDLAERSLEMARLDAQISKQYQAYQKLPRRKFIGARTHEYRFAQYVEQWRIKVERVGNLNYPQAARRNRVFGNLQLTVAIRANGSVESIEVSRSSGKSLLDAAAVRIVRLAAPYAPLPPEIRRDTDVLSITRTWSFTENSHLETE